MNNLQTLQSLLYARGPCGLENEVRALCKELMSGLVDELFEDEAGNVIGLTKGQNKAPPLHIMVHMDEISLMVKRVEKDGRLKVIPLGGIYPFTFGQGPVEIMGDMEILPGILSNGPMHTSRESKSISKAKPTEHHGDGKAVNWEDMYVITRRTKEELKEAGIHAGIPVVIAQSRRTIHEIGDCYAAHFMDNRAAITTALMTLNRLKKSQSKPLGDVYMVCSTAEEIGGIGACYAARTLPGEITLAIDVGPVAEEYQTELSPSPIIVYKDSYTVYDPSLCRQLLAVGLAKGLEPQTAVWEGYGSDASIAKKYGQTPRAALVCFPTENTHGFEVIHKNAMKGIADLLASFLLSYG
jgi:putative aminopeptidase FrvX